MGKCFLLVTPIIYYSCFIKNYSNEVCLLLLTISLIISLISLVLFHLNKVKDTVFCNRILRSELILNNFTFKYQQYLFLCSLLIFCFVFFKNKEIILLIFNFFYYPENSSAHISSLFLLDVLKPFKLLFFVFFTTNLILIALCVSTNLFGLVIIFTVNLLLFLIFSCVGGIYLNNFYTYISISQVFCSYFVLCFRILLQSKRISFLLVLFFLLLLSQLFIIYIYFFCYLDALVFFSINETYFSRPNFLFLSGLDHLINSPWPKINFFFKLWMHNTGIWLLVSNALFLYNLKDFYK